MSSCIFGKSPTPLEIAGRLLPDDADATGHCYTFVALSN